MIQPVTTKEGNNEIPLIKSDMKTEVMACDGEDAPLASISDEKTDNMRKKKKWWKKRSMEAQNRLKGTKTVYPVKINVDGSLKKSKWILNNCLLMTVSKKNYLITQRMVSETVVDLVLKEKGKEEDLVASIEKLSQKRRKSAKKKKKARWRFRNWVFVIPGDEAHQQVDVKHEKDNMEVYVNMVQYHEWCYQLFYTLHVLNKRFGLIFTKKKKGKTKLEYTWVEINPELVLTKCLRRHRKVRGICEKLRDSKQISTSPRFFEEVEKFLEKVLENIRNESMYTVLIKKYAESGKKDIDRAEAVFKKMRELCLLLKPSPFSSMTSLYISVGNKVKVDEILREMKENNVKDLNDPMELMSLYAEAGDSKDVYRIWNLYKKTREQDNDGFLTLNFDDINGAAVMYYMNTSGIVMNKTLRNIKFGNKSVTLSLEEWGKIGRNQVKPSELRDLIKNLQDSTQLPKALEPFHGYVIKK
ncbi:hypothetical protein F2Q70_00029307 [Brassica cretica]|uniref:Pentacotripeptide-repeat region of PRORP domain-containing protein n=1 Tax=Brassica cretica TaxID=69181 RepID=A0A3N6QGT3_BRACR|nr:hypothetical protein F2Q70_00029307 [Brassica cretica]KAF3595033.1 hypothetical protein DY000_02020736 [Brassica cretica]